MSDRTEDKERSAAAYRRWRGTMPEAGYGYALSQWCYEDQKLQECWDAAVAWAANNARQTPLSAKDG
jgi:hypothetical protein